jgi:hypothetical protein
MVDTGWKENNSDSCMIYVIAKIDSYNIELALNWPHFQPIDIEV